MTRDRWILFSLVVVLASMGSAFAQSGMGAQPGTPPSRYPPALPKRQGPVPPPLAFRIVATLALPGKLSGGTPTLEGGQLRMPLERGVAVFDATTEHAGAVELESVPLEDAGRTDGAHVRWIESANGKRRFRAAPDGRIEAEHRCRWCATGWRTEWRARLPGPVDSEPLVAFRRVFVGAMDARVHCLRMENGHRLWASDVGDRVVRPIVLWSGIIRTADPPRETPLSLLLVLGQGGGTLAGLDPHDGRKVATYELRPADGRFASGALALPDGRIAIARETYASPEGELLLLALEPAPAKEPSAPPEPYGKVSVSRAGR